MNKKKIIKNVKKNIINIILHLLLIIYINYQPKFIYANNINYIISSPNYIHNQKFYNKFNSFYKKKYKLLYKKKYNNIYRVKINDTLFHISLITHNDILDLAKYNNLKKPYILYINQKIYFYKKKINNKKNILIINKNIKKNISNIKFNINNSYNVISSYSNNIFPLNINKKNILSISIINTKSLIINPIDYSYRSKKKSIYNWKWPTKGKIIDNFSSLEGGNQGIDISGFRGQPIFATADGLVVYVGHALNGYGNLIIIKHNNYYLSAYAHNDTILVKEKQKVKAIQKVATMGSTGTNSVRLHFEIRYKGKSINPLNLLSLQ
ncbi:Murein hydrolase activator NlpD [Serratia symbiotica]|nr:Murein hydrolase activator NlpD [Serratia symbiotica]